MAQQQLSDWSGDEQQQQQQQIPVQQSQQYYNNQWTRRPFYTYEGDKFPKRKLGNRSIFAQLGKFRERLYIHVRYFSPNPLRGKGIYPDKRGIALTPSEWYQLIDNAPGITQELEAETSTLVLDSMFGGSNGNDNQTATIEKPVREFPLYPQNQQSMVRDQREHGQFTRTSLQQNSKRPADESSSSPSSPPPHKRQHFGSDNFQCDC